MSPSRCRLRADRLAAARRHPLHRGARLVLLGAALAGLWLSIQHAALVVERMRFANRDDDAVFRDTLVAETLAAAATMDFAARIDAALDAEDYELARVLHGAAAFTGTAIEPATAARFEAATSPTARALRAGRDAALGAVTGACETPACLAGALGADLAVPLAADLRDVAWQGGTLLAGGDGDEVVLGLAAIGLAVPFAQPATDPLKAALRYGRRSGALSADLRRLAAGAVDLPGLRAWLGTRRALVEPGAAARFLRPKTFDRLYHTGRDLVGVGRHGGLGAASMALRHAESAADLGAYHRAARLLGEDAAGAMAVLGRRLPDLGKTWWLGAPLVGKLVALGALAAGALSILTGAIASALSESVLRRGVLAGLARGLARR